MDYKSSILKYANELLALPYNLGKDAKILFKTKDGIMEIMLENNDKPLSELNICRSSDIYSEALSNSSYNALIIARPPFTSEIITHNSYMHAVIDDFGMIGGYKIKSVPKDSKKIAKSVSFNGACFVDGYAACFGMTLYEAYTLLTIMEKNAKIIIKSKAIGGAKHINPFIARLERKGYLNSYSQNERSRKDVR